MPEPTPIERAYQFIQQGHIDDASHLLANILKANPQDAMAWALSARLSPDAERCAFALRQVVERSQDNDLAQWAIQQLSLVADSGKMDSTQPPLLGISQGNQSLDDMFRENAQSPRNAVPSPSAPTPVRLSKPLPTSDAPQHISGGMSRTIREVGGLVMICGVLLIVSAVLSQPVFDTIARIGILPGWIGITLIVVGGVLVIAGYLGGR